MRLSYQAFYRVPVAGWLVRDAVCGQADAKYYLAGNLIVMLGALIYTFGYPLVICLALAGAALGLSGLVLITAGDVFAAEPTDPSRVIVGRDRPAVGKPQRGMP
ncbi:MAG TPA: hypothetical protein VMM15_13640 [Bradyrhizobium sp.]|nr:hypothetical protein [Bradyrhizobium sp.]